MADSIAVMNNGRVEICGEKRLVFAAPVTRTGAMLTGCKNISVIERLSQNRIYAADWGMELCVNDLSENTRYVGIRMHDLHPGEGDNTVLCKVVEVIENPFSVTVMLRPAVAENTVPIGWETEKEIWRKYQADELYMSLPRELLLLLEDKKNA